MSILIPIIFALSAFLAFAPMMTEAITKRNMVVIELIHRFSVRSPYYNLNVGANSNGEGDVIKSSLARITYLRQKVMSEDDENYKSYLLPSSLQGVFYINISIGHPPVIQFTIMDTGSSLLWVQCSPCLKCSPQLTPLFDPFHSSTYSYLLCSSYSCRTIHGNCSLHDKCQYHQKYISGYSSIGVLSMDQLVDNKATVIHNRVIFGCGHDNGKFRDPFITGIFGLGSGTLSTITQIGSGFSYCVGNLSDHSYKYHKLIIGEGVKFEGDSTPLEIFRGSYYVTLEGIRVGQTKLVIDPQQFRRTELDTGGVVIDSGTTLSYLVQPAFEALGDSVKYLLKDWQPSALYKARHGMLCYEGLTRQDLHARAFPTVTFQFAGGADLVMERDSFFTEPAIGELTLCMAVAPVEESDLSIIGMLAQQNYNVGYDIAGMKLSFQYIDCELLDDDD